MPPTMWHRGASLTPVASHDDKVVAANVLNGNRSNATPRSDDVRTISTAIDADGQSEHVSRGLRPRGWGSARARAGCLSIFGQSARCTAYLRPEHYGSGSENRY